VIQRADEITEILAFYQAANSRNGIKKLNKLSKQVQKGLATAFNKFDEYQFAKYNRQTEIKLQDALFLVHPKAKSNEQQTLFDKIINDTLEVPYTWEVELSVLGQTKFESEAEKKMAFKAKWEELIASGKLGYMALLRNLRNILQADVSKDFIQKVAERLADERQVAQSKQLPFRFLSAYRELKSVESTHTTLVLNALEKAILASVVNLKGFDENTKVLIACDTSGSMATPVSKKSTVQMYDIGLVLGMLLQSKAQSVMSGIFGDTWKIINLPQNGVLANADALRSRMGEVGYATNGYLVIEDLIKRKAIMDKVMIFTDMQLWNSGYNGKTIAKEWTTYKTIVPNARLYLFDLAGYGQAPLDVKSQDVCLIAGWSDKVFEVLESIENGADALSQVDNLAI
jgi:60 kDa SS-A/Ro ribonucleoprotein